MQSKRKYIGIESRVQFDLLETALVESLLHGTLNKDQFALRIRQVNKGENRCKKILKHISVFLDKNEKVLQQIRASITAQGYYQLTPAERKALILSMFCCAYPIAYDILCGFAQTFKVQDTVSKSVILQKIYTSYGSNRAANIAITESIPLILECGLLHRVKTGIYSMGNRLSISNKLIAECIIFTDIRCSGSKSILIQDINFKPWFAYFNLPTIDLSHETTLLSQKSGLIGDGYLLISG